MPVHDDAVKDGFIFTGWDPALSPATKDITYTAKFVQQTPDKVAVSFNTNGGSYVDTQVITKGGTAARPADPTKTGSTFVNWYTDNEFGTLFNFEQTINENTVVYAKWTEDHIHTPERVNGQAATCTADGWQDYYQCTGAECSKLFSDMACTKEITDLSAWKSGDGRLPAAGHKAVMIPQKDATTEADGYKAHWHCPICDRYFRDNSGSVGTEIGNAEALASWKTGEGKIPMITPAHVHTPETILGQKATCTDDGWKDYYQCTDTECKKLFSDPACKFEITNLNIWKSGDGKIAKTGHDTVHILQKDSTTDAYGYKEHWYCINCKKYFSDSACSGEIGYAAALETWKAKAQSEGGGRIEKLVPHTHTYGTATYYWSEDLTQCTGYHTCTESSCQYTESEIVEAVKGETQYTATFTKSGFTTQYKDIPIPTHVHTFAEGWTSNAIAHWHAATCDHKDVVSGFAEHTWGTGESANKCTECGYEKVIPKPEKVVVDFNTDGGSFIIAQHIEKGSKATRPSNPTKEGYKFDNWYTDTSYSTPFDFTGVINVDTTVYAKWTPNGKEQYTINWKDYDGKLLATSIVDERDIPKYPESSKPSRSGYIFTGWTPEINLATADTTYTATYEKKSSGGGGGGGGGGSTPTATTKKAGGTFSSNWYSDVYGVWRIRNNKGEVVKNAWLCDDVITANGQNVWYLLGADGAMLASGLVQDKTGNFYSLETEHNGYFGMLRYKDGYYNCNGQQVYLTFNRQHNGSFGAITNADGLEKLKAIYGVTQYGIGNENAVYTATF